MSPGEPAARTTRAEARAQAAWSRVRQRLRTVTPADVGRSVVTLLLLAALIWLAVASWPALLPFVVGGFFAYAMLPLVNFLDHLMPRPLAALLTLAAFVFVVAGLFYLLLPPLAEQALRLFRSLLSPEALSEFNRRLDDALGGLPEPSRSLAQSYVDQVSATARSRIQSLIGGLAAASVSGALGLVGTLSSMIGLLLLPLWMLGVLISQRSAMPALRRAIPDLIENDVVAVIRIVNRTLNAFLRGQLLLGLAVGVTLYAEAALLERYTSIDIRYPVLMSLLAALLQLIPQVGPLLGLLLFGALGLAVSPELALLVVALYSIALLLVSNLVAPRLQRQLNNLNPGLLVLFIAALSQFGIVWALLSAPLLAIMRDVLRYAYGRLADPPAPAGVLPGERRPAPPARPAAAPRPVSSASSSGGRLAYRRSARTR